MSLRNTAARMPSGTANTRAANDTYSDPTMIASEPKTGRSAVGRQSRLGQELDEAVARQEGKRSHG